MNEKLVRALHVAQQRFEGTAQRLDRYSGAIEQVLNEMADAAMPPPDALPGAPEVGSKWVLDGNDRLPPRTLVAYKVILRRDGDEPDVEWGLKEFLAFWKPVVEPLPAEPAQVECPTCHGCGWVQSWVGRHPAEDPPFQDVCPECEGRRTVPCEDEPLPAEAEERKWVVWGSSTTGTRFRAFCTPLDNRNALAMAGNYKQSSPDCTYWIEPAEGGAE